MSKLIFLLRTKVLEALEVNVFDTMCGCIYFLMNENFGREFQTQCAKTFVLTAPIQCREQVMSN